MVDPQISNPPEGAPITEATPQPRVPEEGGSVGPMTSVPTGAPIHPDPGIEQHPHRAVPLTATPEVTP